MNTKKIIFVCTDNFGRSIIVEYSLKDYLKKQRINGIEVSSAGTDADSDTTGFSVAHIAELKKLGIEAKIDRTQLTKELAESADVLVCFDLNNQKWIKDNLQLDAPLFNKFYINKDSDLKYQQFSLNRDEGMTKITDYIVEAIPIVFGKIKKDCL